MKKLYCFFCGKYRKFWKPKISYLIGKALVLYIISSKCEYKEEDVFKENKSIKILKVFGLIENI